MSFAAILGAFESVTLIVSATRRLIKAATETEPTILPPAPPPLGSGYPEALAYVRGRDDEAVRREEQERLGRGLEEFARKAAESDGEPEKPIDE